MSKIAYCSIQEAWGIDYDELHNQKDNNNDNSNDNSNNIINDNKNDEIKILEEKIKELELQYERLLKQKQLENIQSKHNQILQKNNNFLEHFAPNQQQHQNQSNIFDLLFLILIGIFVIYIIDNIFTIKKLKK